MIEAGFKSAMEQAGLSTRDKIIPDGKLYRFHVSEDSQGSRNGWYILYSDNLPCGVFGSWKTGVKVIWCAKAESTFTPAERRKFSDTIKRAQAQREAEEAAQRKAAQDKAIFIWKSSPSAPLEHPYLVKKGVSNHGLRLYKDALVIPLRDSRGILHSLQFIDGEGNKRFLSGGRKRGCYFPIGSPTESLCIAEGYATAASIYESTGLPVAVAFDAGNLEAVAKALREKFPYIEITLCADNDEIGISKAREAAACCGGLLAIPPIHGDFNDLYKGQVR